MTSPDEMPWPCRGERVCGLAPRAIGTAVSAGLRRAAGDLPRPAAGRPASPWEIVAAALGMVGLAAMAVQFVTSGLFEAVSARLGNRPGTWPFTRSPRGGCCALVLHPVVYVVPTWQARSGAAWERLWAYHYLPLPQRCDRAGSTFGADSSDRALRQPPALR